MKDRVVSQLISFETRVRRDWPVDVGGSPTDEVRFPEKPSSRVNSVSFFFRGSENMTEKGKCHKGKCGL